MIGPFGLDGRVFSWMWMLFDSDVIELNQLQMNLDVRNHHSLRE